MGMPCPLGQPGDELIGVEAFARTRDDNGEPLVVYCADGAVARVGETLTPLAARWNGRRNGRLEWLPASEMPAELARWRWRITSVAVRRVALMTETEAADWGCYAADISGFTAANRSRSTAAVEMACGVWHSNWPAAEWAWVMGVTQEEARCQSTK